MNYPQIKLYKVEQGTSVVLFTEKGVGTLISTTIKGEEIDLFVPNQLWREEFFIPCNIEPKYRWESAINQKLVEQGVILSTDSYGELQIQRIDDVRSFKEETGITAVQLNSDKEALEVFKTNIVKEYARIIQEEPGQNKYSTLTTIIRSLSEQELIKNGIELGVI